MSDGDSAVFLVDNEITGREGGREIGSDREDAGLGGVVLGGEVDGTMLRGRFEKFAEDTRSADAERRNRFRCGV